MMIAEHLSKPREVCKQCQCGRNFTFRKMPVPRPMPMPPYAFVAYVPIAKTVL